MRDGGGRGTTTKMGVAERIWYRSCLIERFTH